MSIGMGVIFQYPMDTGTGMRVIFENKYERGYSSTRPSAIPTLDGVFCLCIA